MILACNIQQDFERKDWSRDINAFEPLHKLISTLRDEIRLNIPKHVFKKIGVSPRLQI